MDAQNSRLAAASTHAQQIIALGIILGFLYWASIVVIALLLAVLLAYFLDPFVMLLERIRLPRALGALVVLLATMAALGLLAYFIVGRLEMFMSQWPRYGAVLQRATEAVDRWVAAIERQIAAVPPSSGGALEAARAERATSIRALVLRGFGSLFPAIVGTTFVPFLLFFMLAAKERVWQTTLDLFPPFERAAVREALDEVNAMLRSYVAGNVLVAGILIAFCWAFFWIINLSNAFLAAVVSGVFSLIPYLGAVLALIPPFLMGATQWKSIGPYLGVAAVLVIYHLIALNVLIPAIVGRRAHLNAFAATLALLFWGWMWGAIGLILAIPVTAAIKVVCDHVPSWRPAARWLGT
jgi:predicted PurR-regulated permease PerM